jgi:hypothetical protein
MTRLNFYTLAIVSLCVCVSSKASFAQSDKLTLDPLRSYLEENDVSKDPLAAEYVALRCAAFYKAGAAAMASESDPEIVPLKNSALARAGNIMQMVIAIDSTRTGRSEKDSSTAMNAAATAISRAYAARMKTAGSDVSKDPVIMGDSDICRGLPDLSQ